jgi:hypothetical protein
MKNQRWIVLCSVVLTLVTGLSMSPQAGSFPQRVYAGDLDLAKGPRGGHVAEICVARQADQVRAFIEGESIPHPTTSLWQCSGQGHDCHVIAANQGPETSWNDAAPGQTYRGCVAFTDAVGRRRNHCSPLLPVSSSGPGDELTEESPEPPAFEDELAEESPESFALEDRSACFLLVAVFSSGPEGISPEEEGQDSLELEDER